MPIRVVITLVFLGVAWPVLADDASVAELVRQLGSEQFSERAKAGRALERLGEKALPALALAARDPNIEISRRAAALQKKIRERVLVAQVLKPRPADLKFTNRPLSTTVLQIQLRTGVHHVFEGNMSEQLLPLDIGPLPLWQALEEFRRIAGFSLSEQVPDPLFAEDTRAQGYLAPGALVLTERKVAPAPQDASGLFLIRALPLRAGAAADDAFFLDIRPDPALEIQGIDGVRFTKVLDPAGLPGLTLVPVLGDPRRLDYSREAPAGVKTFGKAACVVPIKLGPGAAAKKCAAIEGALSVRMLAKNPVITVDDLAKSLGKKWQEPGGASLKVLQVETLEDGDLYVHVQLEDFESLVQNQPGPRFVRPRPGFIAFRGPADQAADCIEVTDSQGRVLPRVKATSQPVPMKTLTAVDLHLTFKAPASPDTPLRLVFSTYCPLAFDVPFTLRDVPLGR